MESDGPKAGTNQPLMRRYLYFFIFSLLGTSAYTQSKDSSLFVQFDLASRWVWRGVSYSETPVIQSPLGYQGPRLNVLVWGSYALGKREYCEFDFIAEYNFSSQFRLGFTDYFGFMDTLNTSQEFSNLEGKTTRHVADLYTLIKPIRGIPISFMWSTWFWGGDRDRSTGKQNYSSYAELRYEKKLGSILVCPFLGGTPWKGFYAPEAALVNAGLGFSRVFALKSGITVPVKVEFILNPSKNNIFMNAMISLR
jgi:hypothetical protein